MRNPFRIDGPAMIAFSGGRTSGVMLHHILAAHDGQLPDDVVVAFCNTGKEHEATLDFVRDCAAAWRVRIRWLEWADAELPNDRWREVDFASASRAGEPFAALIERKGYLPNPVTRFCTTDMKIHATHRFARAALGWDTGYTKAIGLRADEPHRVARGRARAEHGKDGWELAFPLYDAGLTVADVVAFWRAQDFDLGLPLAPDGTTPMGNCDLCFLKARGKIAGILAAEPQRVVWWAAQERAIGATFRKDVQSYAAMASQGVMAFDDEPELLDCGCTD